MITSQDVPGLVPGHGIDLEAFAGRVLASLWAHVASGIAHLTADEVAALFDSDPGAEAVESVAAVRVVTQGKLPMTLKGHIEAASGSERKDTSRCWLGTRQQILSMAGAAAAVSVEKEVLVIFSGGDARMRGKAFLAEFRRVSSLEYDTDGYPVEA